MHKHEIMPLKIYTTIYLLKVVGKLFEMDLVNRVMYLFFSSKIIFGFSNEQVCNTVFNVIHRKK